MSRVFVTEVPVYRRDDGSFAYKFDIRPAEQYGELVMPRRPTTRSPLDRVASMRDMMQDFTRDDYLLPLGDPGIIATAALIAAGRSGGRVKLLVWDRYSKTYNEVHAHE